MSAQVTTLAPDLQPGDRVRILLGELSGRAAVVVRKASWKWANAIPLYELDVDGIAVVRTIRGDFLRKVPT
jgi:hypothetical protein